MELSNDVILKKVLHYCAYQDRCTQEVRTKLSTFDMPDAEKEKIVKLLVDEGYLDDERYASTFVRSKIHLKKWGVNKIKMSLKMKGISDEIIGNALSEIDPEIYKDELIKVLKAKKINESDPYKKKAKLAQYAIQKGYEPSLVWDALRHFDRSEA
ncbi:MAG: RecX family transcriptional regulator [Bacteroidales bacterium]|nr:RecX family transcriptional regulator [Bacteroidales bacterium]